MLSRLPEAENAISAINGTDAMAAIPLRAFLRVILVFMVFVPRVDSLAMRWLGVAEVGRMIAAWLRGLAVMRIDVEVSAP